MIKTHAVEINENVTTMPSFTAIHKKLLRPYDKTQPSDPRRSKQDIASVVLPGKTWLYIAEIIRY